MDTVFQALQTSLGGYYVNDINLFGRRWQVQVQAEADDRNKVDDIYRINVRNNDGKMIPLRSLVEVRVVVGPPALIRYNNVRAVTVQGRPAPGVSSGQALKAMEEVAAKTLPAGFVGEWTDTAFQEKRAEGKTAMILGLAVLFAYLFLVGLYANRALRCWKPRRRARDLRFRPVMMTSFAFILGLCAIGDRHRRGASSRATGRRRARVWRRDRSPPLSASSSFRPFM